MSQHVLMTSNNYAIPAEHISEAWEWFQKEAKAVAEYYQKTFPNMSVIDTDTRDAKDLIHGLEMLGFEIDVYDDGGISIMNFNGKWTVQKGFIMALAKFASPDWFLEFEDEDGTEWALPDEDFDRLEY